MVPVVEGCPDSSRGSAGNRSGPARRLSAHHRPRPRCASWCELAPLEQAAICLVMGHWRSQRVSVLRCAAADDHKGRSRPPCPPCTQEATLSAPERTQDGRHVVIDGRRWRATDPAIPEALKSELVGELMAARRAVGSAADAGEERAARDRVQDAKVALGERGPMWWEPRTEATVRPRLEAAARALLRRRDPSSTICPSDMARVGAGQDWREFMDLARTVADDLAARDTVVVLQSGEPVASAVEARGPVRIGRGAGLA